MNGKGFLTAALEYEAAGLSVLRANRITKTPITSWTKYQEERAKPEELEEIFAGAEVDDCAALSIVTGKVSENFEIQDFDHKAELFKPWCELVEREKPGLLDRLVILETQSGGRHIGFRCPETIIPGNAKLAERGIDTPDEQEVIINGKSYRPRKCGDKWYAVITLIETRGEGGQFLTDPTPGYKIIQGDLRNPPVITPQERNTLINAAKALNEWVDPGRVEGTGWKLPKESRRPGDDYNQQVDPTPLLVAYGWELVGERGSYQHFRRPGKTRGQSASLINGTFFHVFTSNGAPFEPDKTYTPFAIYTLLEHEGDYSKAATELAREGYGEKKSKKSQEEQESKPTQARRIAQSVGRSEPSPAPAIDATASERSFLPIPPSFPLEVFPRSCQRAITEIQRAHGVPVEIPGCAFLGTAGGCIGRTRGVRIKQGWVEHANLWFAIVAPSGYGKSPAVREIQRPVFNLEKKWFADYQEAQRQYNLELEQRRLTHKDERTTLPPPPDPPVWRQLIVDDTTTEALTDALAGNPRGIQWTRDELAGLLQDLDKYARKEGGTKARMMSAYDSGPWKVNRREVSKRAFIPCATLSIFGTIQPKALPTIFSDLDAATGFLPRFIFVSSTRETPPLWTDETVSGKTRDYLAITIEKLMALDFDEEVEPIIIGVSREAKDLYEKWFNEQVLEPWKNLEASVHEAVLAKLRGQCLRIALVLHCLEAVDARGPDVSPVSLETMEKAITLANFFKAHQRNAWQSIVNRDKVADLPPLPRQVAQAILSLEDEIRGGMLATARITEQVNLRLDPRFHVSPDAIGRTAPVLKMVTDKLPDRSGRGFRIKPEDLQRLHSYFPSKTSILSVPSDHNSETMKGSGENPSDHEVSQVTGSKPVSGHLGHLPDTYKIPEEDHDTRASDSSDTSDASFSNEDEILVGRV